MVLVLPEYSQRPYRYGMTLLCVGAMFNWLGLAENNAEPVRYIGVTLIAAGAMLICLAMCFWMKASHDAPNDLSTGEDQMHHIVTIHQGDVPLEKPPDYDSVTGCSPPCYEDAIRLNPALLLPSISSAHDTTDSVKQDASPGLDQSSASSTAIHSLPKSEANNSKPSNDVAPNPSETTTQPEDSSQISDNFGSRMLRLSKRLLRGKRGSVSPHVDDNSAAESVEDNSRVEVAGGSCDTNSQTVINNSDIRRSSEIECPYSNIAPTSPVR